MSLFFEKYPGIFISGSRALQSVFKNILTSEFHWEMSSNTALLWLVEGSVCGLLGGDMVTKWGDMVTKFPKKKMSPWPRWHFFVSTADIFCQRCWQKWWHFLLKKWILQKNVSGGDKKVTFFGVTFYLRNSLKIGCIHDMMHDICFCTYMHVSIFVIFPLPSYPTVIVRQQQQTTTAPTKEDKMKIHQEPWRSQLVSGASVYLSIIFTYL